MNVGIYVSRKNADVKVEVIEVDSKTKTLIYGGADGKTHSVSWSSFRKSYKPKDDAPVNEESKPVKKTAEKHDDIKKDDKSAEKKEKSEKPKKERKKRDMSEADATFKELCGIAEKHFTLKTWEKIPRLFVARTDDNKSLFEVRVSSKGITFNFRKDQAPGEVVRTQNNYYMPEVVIAQDIKGAETIIKLYIKRRNNNYGKSKL